MAEGKHGNVETKQMSNEGESQIDKILSEEGKSAYVRLCCIELCLLYPEKHERAFVKNYIQQLIKYLGLSRQAQLSIVGLLLCALEQNGVDIKEDPANNTKLLIEKLKTDCGQHQKLVALPKDLLSFSLQSEKYDARHRVLVYCLANKLDISSDIVADMEDELVSHLKACKNDEKSEEEKKQRKEDESARKFQKGLWIGLGAIGGGALLGLTGGLAAPLIAAGAGTLFGGSFAVALASVKGVAVLASLFGAAGAGLTGQKLNRRLGDIEQFEFEKVTKGDHLNVVIAVSGWLKEEQDETAFEQCGFREPWKKMKVGREQYCLKWESKYLMELGSSISSFLTSSALGVAAEETLKHTVIQGLVSAVAWPLTVVKFGFIIDNPWNVCATRAVEVGKHLANILMERRHGNRPVTLVGFSFGARVIFNCLKALSSMKDSKGIVQEVILIGAPVTGDPTEWQCFDKVVAGRIVNGYYKKDWLLLFVYRTASIQVNVAGLRPVMWQNRRMFNVNLANLVRRHTDYCDPDIMEDILDAMSMGGVCPLDVDNNDDDNDDINDSGISSLPDQSAATSSNLGHIEPSVPQEQCEDGCSVVEQLRQFVMAKESEMKERQEHQDDTFADNEQGLKEDNGEDQLAHSQPEVINRERGMEDQDLEESSLEDSDCQGDDKGGDNLLLDFDTQETISWKEHGLHTDECKEIEGNEGPQLVDIEQSDFKSDGDNGFSNNNTERKDEVNHALLDELLSGVDIGAGQGLDQSNKCLEQDEIPRENKNKDEDTTEPSQEHE